ncbi:N-acetylmuramoyl-L-alanine amidase [Nocardia arizonensis]|uniref:N-acetylmuramoyl-L-alanine amidase n=1 Tax=Nocardia arizonensis TaxID=1141647 RepID=UPI0006CFE085|nr:N-acetylmuramoyl-L-alanine amidase [Nocardia arizonensis]
MKPTVIRTGIRTAIAAAVVLGASAVPAVAFAAPDPPANSLAGRTVFVDPGHQAVIAPENLSKQVDNGRGGTKDCQTTGMTSLNGIPEHTINWDVAQLVKTALESLGARVVLSRPDDTGSGPCVDERARAANASGAAVAVSIHADSAPATAHGFHLIVPQLPIPDAEADRVQSTSGLAASKAVRDAYVQAGFQPANYAGVQDGLQTRADIAGPALTRVPNVFVEMGNGANPEDAAVLESSDGKLKHAVAITTGLVGYLLSATPAGTSGSAGDRPATEPATEAPRYQAAPGKVAPATEAPRYRAVPGKAVPATPSVPGGTGAPTARVIELLAPLAKVLGGDGSALTTELINLAYTLAATFVAPGK